MTRHPIDQSAVACSGHSTNRFAVLPPAESDAVSSIRKAFSLIEQRRQTDPAKVLNRYIEDIARIRCLPPRGFLLCCDWLA